MSVASEVELKGLSSRAAKLQGELKGLGLEEEALRGRKNGVHAELKRVREQIAKLQQAEVIISEHAILRYLQRVKGIDLEAIKKEILPDKVAEQIRVLGGAGTFPVQGSHRLKVKNNTIVSILECNHAGPN